MTAETKTNLFLIGIFVIVFYPYKRSESYTKPIRWENQIVDSISVEPEVRTTIVVYSRKKI